jgi:dephospho-CoA kinase
MALAFFEELGARTLAADEVVARLYRRPEVREALRSAFGDGVLAPRGEVDRAVLGRMVASDPEALLRLEALVHPLVGQELRSFVEDAAAGEVSVCEVPLLFQSGLEPLFDLIVTIEADPEMRRHRRRARGGAEILDELDRVQLSSEERVRRSDLAFLNEGSLEELRTFVAVAFETALVRAGRRGAAGAPHGERGQATVEGGARAAPEGAQ